MEQFGINQYVETSAKNNVRIEEIFTNISSKILRAIVKKELPSKL